MKALDILKQYQDDMQMSIPDYVNLDEAIEELEEIENRSCNNCKWEMLKLGTCYQIDLVEIYSDFCCNQWASK